MKKLAITLISATLFSVPIAPANVGWAAPTVYAESETEHSENPGHEEKTKDDEMKKEKDHDHDGMHGMMMGHSKGWMIVIGAVMIVMMAAMVL